MFFDFENPIKVHKITVSGHIGQVLQQYMVGETPELGPHFREVNAVVHVLPIKDVYAYMKYEYLLEYTESTSAFYGG